MIKKPNSTINLGRMKSFLRVLILMYHVRALSFDIFNLTFHIFKNVRYIIVLKRKYLIRYIIQYLVKNLIIS